MPVSKETKGNFFRVIANSFGSASAGSVVIAAANRVTD